jgi:CheY-like chemotaxis protein
MSDVLSRLLVVEDEPLVRMFAVDALEDLGFQVDEAGTAAEALALLGEGRDYRVALADVRLPDRSNETWALELRQQRPGLPLLVLSGLDERSIRDAYQGADDVGFLQKPYNQNALVSALEGLGVSLPDRGDN